VSPLQTALVRTYVHTYTHTHTHTHTHSDRKGQCFKLICFNYFHDLTQAKYFEVINISKFKYCISMP
jgi:hypothetical protein